MSDIERVQAALQSGQLLSPMDLSANRPGFIDFVRAVAQATGAPLSSERLSWDHPQHLVFVLIDGMGLNQISDEASPFLKAHLQTEMRAVFPSTTAVVLTALATAAWPATHSVPGWWTYLDAERALTTLPFTIRGTNADAGIDIDAFMALKSWWPTARRQILCLQPHYLVGSAFSTYFCGHGTQCGYRTLEDAVDLCVKRVRSADSKNCSSATYLYWPKLDGLSHRFGPHSPEAQKQLCDIDRQLEHLASLLPKGTCLLVTADHGLVQAEQPIWLSENDPLLSLLELPPTGEPSVPIFHVKASCMQSFETQFRDRFGDVFFLCTPQECADLSLFGPESLSEKLRFRLGNYIGIAPKGCAFYVKGVWEGEAHRGLHGGLRPDEMRTPLISCGRV